MTASVFPLERFVVVGENVEESRVLAGVRDHFYVEVLRSSVLVT
jgi:hypothetical protein